MDKEILTFGDTEIEKHKFHRYKVQFFLEDVDIDNELVSKKAINTSLVTCMMIIKLSYYT